MGDYQFLQYETHDTIRNSAVMTTSQTRAASSE